jgi:hypothetical protein
MSSTKRRTGFPAKDILHLIIHLLHNLPVYGKELVLLLPVSTSAESINKSGAILISIVSAPTMVIVSEYKTAITRTHFSVRDFFGRGARSSSHRCDPRITSIAPFSLVVLVTS